MSLQNRIQKLENSTQVHPPAGAALFNTDGVQVNATVTRMPTKYDYGEAELPNGAVVPLAPTPMLEDLIMAARWREQREPEESSASIELPEGVLFLRVNGHQDVIERMYRGQKRRQEGRS